MYSRCARAPQDESHALRCFIDSRFGSIFQGLDITLGLMKSLLCSRSSHVCGAGVLHLALGCLLACLVAVVDFLLLLEVRCDQIQQSTHRSWIVQLTSCPAMSFRFCIELVRQQGTCSPVCSCGTICLRHSCTVLRSLPVASGYLLLHQLRPNVLLRTQITCLSCLTIILFWSTNLDHLSPVHQSVRD